MTFYNRTTKSTFRAILVSALFILAALTPSQAQVAIPMGPQIGTYTGAVRGYYFIAPVNFTICQLYVEDNINTQMQHVEVVRLDAVPPTFPSTTNGFTSLFYQNNWVPNTPIPCTIPISAGQIIGVYGARGNGTTMYNSYGPSPWTATVYGSNFDMLYSGMQFPLSNQQMHDIWYANFNRTGRVTMYYDCVILDERLFDFTAVPVGETAVLSWEMASETDIARFELERSQAGSDFSVIATVPFQADKAAVSDFRYVDQQPAAQTNFYRIRMVDLNGESSYSNIQTVTFGEPARFDLYPNPMETGGDFNIRATEASEALLRVEVVDMQGRLVFVDDLSAGSGRNEYLISPGFLPSGVYLVKIRQGDEIAAKRLLVR